MTMKQQIQMMKRRLSLATDEYDKSVWQNRIDILNAMSALTIKQRYMLSEKFGVNKELAKTRNQSRFMFPEWAIDRTNFIERSMLRFFAFDLSNIPARLKTKEELIRNRLKYARITYKGKEGYITFVDNETMIAYKMRGEDEHYYNGLLKPLTPISEPYTFERWCRGMDL